MYFRSFFRVSAVAVVALVVAALPARAVPTHDVYILLDKSGSMGQANFDAQISTIGSLISDYGGQANNPMRFSIIDFATTSNVVHSLDDPQDLPSVLSALDSIVYTDGWTEQPVP
ncbi:MAG: VWA domain-containing protein [Alphaproteobacteria bacterium]|nr:VWA domain-containing protein [Alphaproteobacteria bacterium]